MTLHKPSSSSTQRRSATTPDSDELRRMRNASDKRRYRKQWNENDREMQEMYDSNQARIVQLERMVTCLSKQLQSR